MGASEWGVLKFERVAFYSVDAVGDGVPGVWSPDQNQNPDQGPARIRIRIRIWPGWAGLTRPDPTASSRLAAACPAQTP